VKNYLRVPDNPSAIPIVSGDILPANEKMICNKIMFYAWRHYESTHQTA